MFTSRLLFSLFSILIVGCSSTDDSAPATTDSASTDSEIVDSETIADSASDSTADSTTADTTTTEVGADSSAETTASDVGIETSDAATVDSTWQVNMETPLCKAKASCTDISGLAAAYQFNVTGFCPTNSQVLIAFHHNADGSPPAAGDYTVHSSSSTIDFANVPAGEAAVRVQHIIGGTMVEQLFAKSGKVVVKKVGSTITATFVALPTNVAADTISGDISCF